MTDEDMTCGGCIKCAWWRAYNGGEGESIQPCPRMELRER